MTDILKIYRLSGEQKAKNLHFFKKFLSEN